MQVTNILFFIAVGIYSIIMLFFYMNAKTKKTRIIASILMALPLALCAYYFIPKSDYDLVRHYGVATDLADVTDIDSFVKVASRHDLEILPQPFSMIVGKTGNLALMQTVIVFIGYALLFYMLIDYKSRKNVQNGIFVPVMLMVVFGQHMLFYFSGLYNYFAINLFAFAVYLNYIVGAKRLPIALYILSAFVHSSMLLPLGLMIIFKLKRNKIGLGFLIFMAIIFLFFDAIVGALADFTNLDILIGIKNTYNSYLAHNDRMMQLYDGFYLIMTVTKILVALAACWIQRGSKDNQRIRGYTYLIVVATIILSISSIALTRFSSLVLFVAFPIIIDALSRRGAEAQALTLTTYVIAIVYAIYSINTMLPLISVVGA